MKGLFLNDEIFESVVFMFFVFVFLFIFGVRLVVFELVPCFSSLLNVSLRTRLRKGRSFGH